jgi:hypothetical protein
VPGATTLTKPPLVTVHIAGVDDVYVTANVELADALRLKSAAVGSLSAIVPNVIVCNLRDINDRVTLGAAA